MYPTPKSAKLGNRQLLFTTNVSDRDVGRRQPFLQKVETENCEVATTKTTPHNRTPVRHNQAAADKGLPAKSQN